MFDLLSFWATATLLTLPSWFVFGVIIICVSSAFLHHASRGRFDLAKTIAPAQNSEKQKIGAGLMMVGALELVILHMIWAVTAITGNAVSPFEQVMNVSGWFAPVGGWLAILALIGIGAFLLIRGAFDAYYKIKEIADKVESSTKDETAE